MTWPLLGAAAAVFLAGVFAFSAWMKLRVRAEFSGSLASILPAASRPVRAFLSWAVPLTELGLAAGLLSGLSAAAAWAAALLLAAFSAVALWPRRIPAACACFGPDSSAPLGWRTALRNAGLGALAVLAAVCTPAGVGRTLVMLDGAAAFILAACVLGGWALSWQQLKLGTLTRRLQRETSELRQENGRLRARLDAQSGADADELALPRPIPAAAVRLHDGTQTSLSALSAERPLLLLFALEGCGVCRMFGERLGHWRSQLGTAAEVRVAFTGSLTAARREWPGEDVLVLEASPGPVAAALGVQSYPAVVLLGANGMIVTAPLASHEHVDALIEEMLALRQ